MIFAAGAILINDHTRFGSAFSLKGSDLIEINKEKFLFAAQEVPMFALQLLASLDKRLIDIKACN